MQFSDGRAFDETSGPTQTLLNQGCPRVNSIGITPSWCFWTQESRSGCCQFPGPIRSASFPHHLQRFLACDSRRRQVWANLIDGAEAATMNCEPFKTIESGTEDTDQWRLTANLSKTKTQLGSCRQNELNRNLFWALRSAETLLEKKIHWAYE